MIFCCSSYNSGIKKKHYNIIDPHTILRVHSFFSNLRFFKNSNLYNGYFIYLFFNNNITTIGLRIRMLIKQPLNLST